MSSCLHAGAISQLFVSLPLWCDRWRLLEGRDALRRKLAIALTSCVTMLWREYKSQARERGCFHISFISPKALEEFAEGKMEEVVSNFLPFDMVRSRRFVKRVTRKKPALNRVRS